jgi:hypothetical protein
LYKSAKDELFDEGENKTPSEFAREQELVNPAC